MLLPDFDYHEPLNLEEACRILAELGSKAKLLAGGTDLIVNMKKKVLSPEHLVSLSRIEELKRVDHLVYVSLKYTRTVDVIRSIIDRLIIKNLFAGDCE